MNRRNIVSFNITGEAPEVSMRLVACDLDGTIVRLDGTISLRTLAAFEACDKTGVIVVFVTGRPVRWMAPIIETTGRTGIAICSNGAVSLDMSCNHISELRPLSCEMVLESIQRLRSTLPPVVFAVDTLSGYGSEPGYFRNQSSGEGRVIGTLSKVVGQGLPLIKLLCRLDSTSSTSSIMADEMLERARRVLTGVAEAAHSNPSGSLLEISALGVSKATTLARFVHSVGLDARDVVAFGDMPNDISMLRWAGRGYAMAGGHPDAIQAATAVAPPCLDDGVAQVIEQILAQR